MVFNKFNYKENLFYRNRYILIILLIAFILRIWGANFGLPYIYNPDEPCYTQKAIHFFTGDFNPHWFGHPGAVLINMLFFLYCIYFIIGLILGNFSSLTGFINFFDTNPTGFYLLGRFATVVFGTITVFILYCLVKKLFDKEYALISTLIFALAPLHVNHSKIIRTDITQTMLILLALYFLIKYLEVKKYNPLIFASIFFALSVATKWPSILLGIPFLIAFIVSEKNAILENCKNNKLNLLSITIIIIISLLLCGFLFLFITRNNLLLPFFLNLFKNKNLSNLLLKKLIFLTNSFLILCITTLSFSLLCFTLSTYQIYFCKVISSAIINILSNKKYLISLFVILFSFFITAPFVFLDFTEAVKCILVEARDTHLGATGTGFFGNIIFYVKTALNKQFGGIIIECISFIGIFSLIKNWKKFDAKHLVIFSFPLIYFLAISKMPLRWDRWVIPIFPFMAIFCAIGLEQLLNIFNFNRSYRNFILCFVLIILIIPPLRNSILNNYKLSQKDTRTTAKEWIELNLPENSIIAYEFYAPHLHFRKREDFKLINMEWYRIIRYPLSYYIKKNVDFIIITNSFKDRYYKKPELFKNEIKRYETLETRCEKIKIFTPKKFQPGPEITIYKVPKK